MARVGDAALAPFLEKLLAYIKGPMRHVEMSLLVDLVNVALSESTLDGTIFWIKYPELRVERFPVEQTTISPDGKSRSVFRCYNCHIPGKPEPIFWTAAQMGLPADSRNFPVFIQRHAIEQWHKRLLPEMLHPSCLSMSLLDPEFERGADGKLLVAYRIAPNRYGYFVCDLIDDKVVLRTFLFLTMQGTPESNRLRQKLGMLRRDVEETGLDRVETVVDSDLADDPALAGVMSECGLGHLLEWSTEAPMTSSYAKILRDYLCMGPVAAN